MGGSQTHADRGRRSRKRAGPGGDDRAQSRAARRTNRGGLGPNFVQLGKARKRRMFPDQASEAAARDRLRQPSIT
jgi:hypothetical protein